MTRANTSAKDKLQSSTTLEFKEVHQVEADNVQTDQSRSSQLRSKNEFQSKKAAIDYAWKSKCLFCLHISSSKRHKSRKDFYDWIVEQRELEIAVSTRNVIEKAFSHDSISKDGDFNKPFNLKYPFLIWWKLSFGVATRISQKLNGHLSTLLGIFVEKIVSKFAPQGLIWPAVANLFNYGRKDCILQNPT